MKRRNRRRTRGGVGVLCFLCFRGAQQLLFTTHPPSFLVRKEEPKSYTYARGKLFLQATPGLTTHKLTLPTYQGLTHRLPNHDSSTPTLLVPCQGCQHCAKFSCTFLPHPPT